MTSSASASCGVHASSTPLVVLNVTTDAVTIDAEDSAAARDNPFEATMASAVPHLSTSSCLAAKPLMETCLHMMKMQKVARDW